MRIYYTGDMANQPGWFVATPHPATDHLALDEEPGGEGRRFVVMTHDIGGVYAGHCNPRFVLASAVEAYRAERMAELRTLV